MRRGIVAGTALTMGMVAAMPMQAAVGAANDACPAGYETITLEQAASEGYVATPTAVDAGGNGDGVVCRTPLGAGVNILFNIDPDFQIYQWQENVTPRKH